MLRRMCVIGVLFGFITSSCGFIDSVSGDDYDERVFLTLMVDPTTCSSGTSGFAIEADRDTKVEVTNAGPAAQVTLIQNSDLSGAATGTRLLTLNLPEATFSEHTINVAAGTYSFDCANESQLVSNFTVGEPAAAQTPAPDVTAQSPNIQDPAVQDPAAQDPAGEAATAQTATIDGFWTEFSAAVATKDPAKAASLSMMPLPIGETGGIVTEADFAAEFDVWLDPRLATTSVDQLEQLIMIEEFSQRYNTPVGQEIYQIRFDLNDGISQTYVFGLEGSEFKLRSIILLQQ